MNKKLTQPFKMQGVTLVELLTVMAIILVIAAMFVGVSGPASQSAKKRKAEVMISVLEVAVGMYKADIGGYPATDSGSGCVNLFDGLTNLDHLSGGSSEISGWSGPYMEFKNEDILSSTQIKDPWGHAYNYSTVPTTGLNNANSFDLWSFGPDGLGGDAAKDADNITNW